MPKPTAVSHKIYALYKLEHIPVVTLLWLLSFDRVWLLCPDEAIVNQASMVTTEISQVPLSGVMALLNSAK